MLPRKLHDWFLFTKKERIAVLSLLVLIIFFFILPDFLPSPKAVRNKEEFEQFKNEIAQLKTQPLKDSFSHYSPKKDYAGDDDKEYVSSEKFPGTKKAELFYFNPNTATPEEWRRLGLRERTIQTISKYTAKGGKFHSPEDLQKIYGLHEDEYQRIMPYAKIESENNNDGKTSSPFPAAFHKEINRINDVDINAADTSVFIALPGIGSKLANRIINFREKLGGFYAIEQIGETYGLQDSVFRNIKPHLKIGDIAIKKININTADVNTLKQHPYIHWNIANAIVQYRQQHGAFKSVEDIQQVAIITPEIFKKIAPYLRCD